MFVNIESLAGQMVVIDAWTLAVKATWSLPGCASPTGLALDKVHHRLFSVCDGKVMVVTNATNGEQIARVVIGAGPDAAAFDSRRGLAFSSNGEGTLRVVHQESGEHYQGPVPAAPSKHSQTRPASNPDTVTVLVARYSDVKAAR